MKMLYADLDDREFEKFKELIYSESGIKLSDMKKALVRARLTKRLRILKLDSFTDYYNYLVKNFNEEKFDFVNAITTNKTDFFRESKHFEFMKEVFLPEFIESGKDELRLWSAGCSTGEEPYTIAITLLEFFENYKIKPEIKILATDIDTSVIEKARSGIYTGEQVKGIDTKILKKYFLKGKDENEGLFRAKDYLKKMISFRRLNLHDEVYPMKKRFDLIFCRNVIIYFDKEYQQRLFDRIFNYMNDTGYLFIGHSENLSSVTRKFKLVGNTIYKKNLFMIDLNGL